MLNSRKTTFWESLSFKIILVGLIILLMLIPGSMIRKLITEREQLQAEVVNEIGSKWGNGQVLGGPVLTIPYSHFYEEKGKTFRQIRYANFLPEELEIESRVESDNRYRGIYETVVYSSAISIRGRFIPPSFTGLKINPQNLLLEDAFLQVGISDMRGIREELLVSWNQEEFEVEPGIPGRNLFASGFHARVPVKINQDPDEEYAFGFELVLNGSHHLDFIPAGKVTEVSMISDWAHPKFDGAFLPDKRDVSEEGFTAGWKILHLNRNFPQVWTGNDYQMDEASFGVDLLMPVDRYHKSMRSAKYAIMFIALTFMIFFFVEVLNRKRIHPVQYLLVGLSISIFYILLLSLSEQIGFNLAYLISAVAVVGLITAYSGSVIKNRRLTIIMGTCLMVLYSFLYTLIQLQDYALLLGSIGLFAAMAVIMYFSRNVDWYGEGGEE